MEQATTDDPTTGLPPQPAIVAQLSSAIADAIAAGGRVAVLGIFFPRLDSLYRGMGYGVGSRVVREIALRLDAGMEDGMHVGHTRRGEFSIVVRGHDAQHAGAQAARLERLFQRSIELDGAPFDMQPFAGASHFPDDGDDADLLLRRASLAAREAARIGVPFRTYDDSLERDNPARLRLAAELNGAIDRRELLLHFQPKISLSTGALSGAEALVRWQHPVHGLVAPDEFIAIAEETGQIRDLTYLVADLAIRQIDAWTRVGIDLPIAINLSARDLQNPMLTERIGRMLAAWNVPAARLHFEVTETALLQDPEEAHRRLEHLHDRGSEIFIDDFGTGYSSLSYLVTLPVQALKIDRSFVVQMGSRREAVTVVASVISMAHGLGLKVVAEGVELASERDALELMGCDEIQGFLVARPLTAEAFAAFVATYEAPPRG